MIKTSFEICNVRGLHARASAKFVKCLENFDANVEVTKDNQTVAGTSIMGLMMLAASIGCTIDVTAEGPDAEAALDALGVLIADKFDESE